MTAAGAQLTARRPELDERLARLTELVIHLTECPPATAMDAVSRTAGTGVPETDDDKLAVVARALVAVRRNRLDLRDRRVSIVRTARPA